jgi:DNA (cytosine-5)-methyltransferase 1
VDRVQERQVRILDAFCGAGGAAAGYHRAFPDAEIVGVDIADQPRYPFTLVQADAMTFDLGGFDLIHASPPCQDHSTLKTMHSGHGTGWMLAATLARLRSQRTPWVVENVPGSGPAMDGQWTMLCGSSFGLKVRRHRLFASSELILGLPCCHTEQGQPWGVYGTGGGGQMTRGYKATPAEAKVAMGIDWMNRAELSQAIPPAFTEWIGTS